MAKGFVPRSRRPTIFQEFSLILNQSFAFKFFNYLPRSVARRVIDCDYFSLVRRMYGRPQRHALHRLPQRPRSVKNRNDYTNSNLSHSEETRFMNCCSDWGSPNFMQRTSGACSSKNCQRFAVNLG